MELGLTDTLVLVTGAGSGIGLATTKAFLQEGAHVVAGSRAITADLEDLGASYGERLMSVGIDLADPDAPAQLVKAAPRPIEVLVNNVGIAPARTEGFLSVTDQMWGDTWNLDLMAAVRAARAVLPAMLAAGRGAIVNTGSINAWLADPLVVDYAATKAALVNWAKSLSKEFGPRGIRVNTVAPGPVATNLWLSEDGVARTVARATGAGPDDVIAGALSQMVTRRFTAPEEVARLIVVLASPQLSNLTGAQVTIDGGMTPTV